MRRPRKPASPKRLRTSVVDVITAISGDLELLAALHDREPTREWLEAARACPIADQFGLVLRGEAGKASMTSFDKAVSALPASITEAVMDDLAVEYANIYLRFLYRAAPSESVWLDEDGLERQQPMFAVKAWYRRHCLSPQDWARRPDDHLVVELRFLAHLFSCAKTDKELAEAARFLDEHLLRWVGQFARRVALETPSLYFAAVALLTDAYLEEVRDLLVAAGLPRREPVPEMLKKPVGKPELTCADAGPYIPGAAPGW